MRRFSVFGFRFSVALLMLLGACRGLGGVRPRITPLHGSTVVTLDTMPAAVVRLVRAQLDSAGVPVVIQSDVEGYVESAWYPACDRPVKLRFFADPVAGKTRLVAEAVAQLMVDPSLPPRELERVVEGACAAERDTVVARVSRKVVGRPPVTAPAPPR